MSGLFELTGPEVGEAIARTGLAVLPLGSVEQHGPHLPCGTDTMAAELVAAEVADRLDGLLVPAGPYGVTPIHAGHPGTISLRRSTLEALLTDICEELIALGVGRLVFINWHEGNIASLDAVATDLQARHDGVLVATAHACYVAQRLYAADGGDLTHGGGIETLAVLARDPALARLDRAGEPHRSEQASAMDAMRRDREVYGYITDVTEIDDQGWYGDPAWADAERAATFAATVAREIAVRVGHVFGLRS